MEFVQNDYNFNDNDTYIPSTYLVYDFFRRLLELNGYNSKKNYDRYDFT